MALWQEYPARYYEEGEIMRSHGGQKVDAEVTL